MTDPQNPRDDDESATPPDALLSLTRRLAYTDAMKRFERAAAAMTVQLGEPEKVARVAAGKAKVAAVAAQLVDNPEYVGVVLLAVRRGTTEAGEEGFGLARSSVGTEALVQSLLPLAHLIGEFERDGVKPPAVDGVETEVQPGDAEPQWPVCPGCGKRHPIAHEGSTH